MSKIAKGPIGVVVVIIAVIGYMLFAPSAKNTAPEFQLPGLDGQPIKLSDYRGKPVLLTFWATTCPSCVAEIPQLLTLHQEFADEGLTIIGVAMSYDPPGQVQLFSKSRGLPYTIALDIQGQAANDYQVRVTPTNVLISPDGHIAYRNLGRFDTDKLRNDIRQMLQTKPDKVTYAVD